MSKVRERPAGMEPRPDRKQPETRERPSDRMRPTPVPPPEVSKYVRWLAWLVGVLVLLGTVALIWWGFGVQEDQLVAPGIENIDPHESPEILRTNIPGLTAPGIENIDPHESPEILRTNIPGLTAPGIENIDPHESPEMLRRR